MAHCVRFELYVPSFYTTGELNPQTGGPVIYSLDPEILAKFISATMLKFKGITEYNPIGPPLFKGWWLPKVDSPIDILFLDYLFGLVRLDQLDEATTHFTTWKEILEQATHQDIILVVYYAVRTIGDVL